MANSKDYILSLFPDNVNNEITAADLRIFVNSIFDEKVDVTSIQDNLVSTDRDKPLSANQGRVLDEKIQSIINDLSLKEDSLGVGSYRQVLATGANGNKEWIDLPQYDQVYVYDNLDSVNSNLALSANQGRILNEKIIQNASLINQNSTTISNLEQQVNQNTSDITQNKSDILQNKNDILDINSNKIPNLQNKDTQLETSINQNTTDISNINTSIGQINNRITTNETDISTIQSDIATINGNISALDSRIATNETEITNIKNQLGNSDLVNIESRLTVVEGNISALDTRVTTNTDSISTLSTNVNNLQGQVNTNATNISTLTGRVTTNETNITNLQNDVVNINGNISTIDSRVTTNETNITNLQNEIPRLDSVDAGLRSDITTNRTLIDRNIVDITNLRQDVQVIQQEQIDQNDRIQQNFVLTQNNLANITYILDQVSSTQTNLSALEMQVNGSPDGTIPGKEDNLGAPDVDYKVLASLKDGTRVWVDNAFSTDLIPTVIDNVDDPIDDIEKQNRQKNALSAYQGTLLDNKIDTKENNLGNPLIDGMLLSSSADGVRRWIEANEFKLDYGYYFGAGAILLRINVIDPVGGIIDNRLENATRQLQCFATYQVTDKYGNIIENTVDVTNDVDWTTSDPNAYTITDGIGGGLIRCTTQDVNGSSYTDIPVSASLTDDQGNIFTSSINISIDNTPVIKSVAVVPDSFTINGINNTYQLYANATYTHNNWNNSQVDITSSATWESNNTNVATVSTTGQVLGINPGQAIISASITRFDGNIITGSSLGTINS